MVLVDLPRSSITLVVHLFEGVILLESVTTASKMAFQWRKNGVKSALIGVKSALIGVETLRAQTHMHLARTVVWCLTRVNTCEVEEGVKELRS